MKIVFPTGVFAALFVFQTFLKTMGYGLLSDAIPGFSGYVSPIGKGLGVLVGISGLWLLNVVIVAVLDKAFAKVLKSSPLAKKLLPLLKYLATVMVWGF